MRGQDQVAEVTILEPLLVELNAQRPDLVQNEFLDFDLGSFEYFSLFEIHLRAQVLKRSFLAATHENAQVASLN